MRVARHVVLSADQQHFLASVAKARRASARSVERAWIVLLAGAGLQDQQIAARLNITTADCSTLAEPVSEMSIARDGRRFTSYLWRRIPQTLHF